MNSLYKRYGFWGSINLLTNLIKTKILISKNARILRFPLYIRGHKYIDWGINLTTGVNLRIDADPIIPINSKILKFGNDVQLNDYVHIGAIHSITIGNNVLIASKVFISDHNHGNYSGIMQSNPNTSPAKRELRYKPVNIEDNVWIGEHVSVLLGVTIGEGAIIGANSVVSKSIPAYCIAVGSPAKVIKEFDFDKQQWIRVEKG